MSQAGRTSRGARHEREARDEGKRKIKAACGYNHTIRGERGDFTLEFQRTAFV